MDQIHQIQVFVRVAETQSFSAIARELNLAQSTVSKQIAALEDRLGTRLLNRSTRNVTLTEQGARYYKKCLSIIDALAEAEAELSKAQTQPSGLLRMACPASFGVHEITPLLPAFQKQYPDLEIELVMSDGFIDLVEEGVDLAIRIGELMDSALIAQRIGSTRRALVTSPAYLKQAGKPADIKGLQHHNCLINTGYASVHRWHFTGPNGPISVKVSGNLRANNSEALREALIRGAGIGLLPVWLVHDGLANGTLVQVLEEYQPRPLPIHALYPQNRFTPLKVSHTVNMLKQAFASKPATCDVPWPY